MAVLGVDGAATVGDVIDPTAPFPAAASGGQLQTPGAAVRVRRAPPPLTPAAVGLCILVRDQDIEAAAIPLGLVLGAVHAVFCATVVQVELGAVEAVVRADDASGVRGVQIGALQRRQRALHEVQRQVALDQRAIVARILKDTVALPVGLHRAVGPETVRIVGVHRDCHHVLAQLTLAQHQSGLIAGRAQHRQQQGGENGDDGDDDQQFDQREAPAVAHEWPPCMRHPMDVGTVSLSLPRCKSPCLKTCATKRHIAVGNQDVAEGMGRAAAAIRRCAGA